MKQKYSVLAELLPKSFYESTDVVKIAKALLGKELITNVKGFKTSGIIVETEAYKAPEDLASHAKGNKRTPRNETMYSAEGNSYMYICYGIHHLFNVVTAPEGTPHAILIRGVEPISGIDIMMNRRRMSKAKFTMMNGPGKFTIAMGLTMDHDRVRLYDEQSPVQIKESNVKVEEIVSGPRVGMSHHTQHCGHWPWRFRIKGNKWASKPDKVEYYW